MEVKYNYIRPIVRIFKQDKTAIDLGDFVQSITISKSINQPAHSCNIVFNTSLSDKTDNGKALLSTDRIFNYLLSVLDINDIIAIQIDPKKKLYSTSGTYPVFTGYGVTTADVTGKSFPAWSFLGFVDHSFEAINTNNRNTGRSLVCNCSLLLPKLLIRDVIVNTPQLVLCPEIKNDPVLGPREEFFTWVRGKDPNNKKKNAFIDRPQKIVEYILENAVATNTMVMDGTTAKSLFPNKQKTTYNNKPLINLNFLGGEFVFGSTLTNFAGPLLEYIKSVVDNKFYEVFFDTTTGQDEMPYNTMTIRTNPFTIKELDKAVAFTGWKYWDDLETIEIDSSYRLAENLGKNDFELKNCFRVMLKNVLGFLEVLSRFGSDFPILNINSVKKYGLRPLDIESTIIVKMDDVIDNINAAIKEGKVESVYKTLKDVGILRLLFEKRDKIKEWFAFPFYESGQMVVPGNEGISIGKRLYYKDKEYYSPYNKKIYTGMYYYINTVEHKFSYPNFFTTTMGLAKGRPKGLVEEWFNDPVNQFIKAPLESKKHEGKIQIETPESLLKRKERYDKMHEMIELM
jgi:hypothetical protein